MSAAREIEIQRRYFADIAQNYQDECVPQGHEHFFALAFLVASVHHFKIGSVLDVGSGTGRAISHIKERVPDLPVIGIEPVQELREVGYRTGLTHDELIDGDVMSLGFEDGAFDLVCAFGVLHHIKCPARAVTEMLRVARKAIFISDSNNFGQGSLLSRSIKQ